VRTVDSTNGRLVVSCHHLRSVCSGLLTVLGSSFFDAAADLELEAGFETSLSFESFARFACFTGTKSLSFLAAGSSFRRSPPKAVLLHDKPPINKKDMKLTQRLRLAPDATGPGSLDAWWLWSKGTKLLFLFADERTETSKIAQNRRK
jgi:hypothetical protein